MDPPETIALSTGLLTAAVVGLSCMDSGLLWLLWLDMLHQPFRLIARGTCVALALLWRGPALLSGFGNSGFQGCQFLLHGIRFPRVVSLGQALFAAVGCHVHQLIRFNWRSVVIMPVLQVSDAVVEAFVPTGLAPLEWVDQEISSGLPSSVQDGWLGLDMYIKC